jgi:hypothetical protein
VSLAQCTTECRSNIKCSAASYSETTLKCHLDISGTGNFQKTPATGWRAIIRGNFGKYNKLEEEFEDTKGIIGIRKSKKNRQQQNVFLQTVISPIHDSLVQIVKKKNSKQLFHQYTIPCYRL